MRIREADDADWPALYPIFTAVVAAGDSYAYPEGATSQEARALWMGGQARTVVAEDGGRILGTAIMGPNRPGRGAHIATGSFMVDPAARRMGVGRALGEHLVAWAGAAGYRGIQFNAVVETNTAAVALWQELGFRILGTVPGAYHHATAGYVGLHVMFRPLP